MPWLRSRRQLTRCQEYNPSQRRSAPRNGRGAVGLLQNVLLILAGESAPLVVNTDADQVIMARPGPHTPGQLPELSYDSGGLENSRIRKQVCEILEGGEKAFRERAKRLRVRI